MTVAPILGILPTTDFLHYRCGVVSDEAQFLAFSSPRIQDFLQKNTGMQKVQEGLIQSEASGRLDAGSSVGNDVDHRSDHGQKPDHGDGE